jgi:hypothetical protein
MASTGCPRQPCSASRRSKPSAHSARRLKAARNGRKTLIRPAAWPTPVGSLQGPRLRRDKLGGWNCYYKPPGPITMRHGMEYFYAIHRGHQLAADSQRDVRLPQRLRRDKLGGWNCYYKPPGPITMRHGMEYFHAIHRGHTLAAESQRDVRLP